LLRLPEWFRSLAAQLALSSTLPIMLVTVGLIGAGQFAYREVVTSLVIDRDRQLATLIAASVTESINGYAGVLEALASNPEVLSPIPAVRASVLGGRRESSLRFSPPGWSRRARMARC